MPPDAPLRRDAAEHVEARIKYAGYIERQSIQVEKLKRMESMRIPDDFDYDIEGLNLSTEARQKLATVLEQSKTEGEVRIKRKDGQEFVIKPAETPESPLDIEGYMFEPIGFLNPKKIHQSTMS